MFKFKIKNSKFLTTLLLLFLLSTIDYRLSTIFAQLQPETLTITTYYPAPFGAYNEMTVANRQAIGDLNGDGVVNNGDLPVTGAGQPLAESLAIRGNVGIGTNAPTHALDVNGQIRIRGGNPADDRILTSNANGVASWKNTIIVTKVKVVVDDTGYFEAERPWGGSGPTNNWNKGTVDCDPGYTRTGCTAICSGIAGDWDLSPTGPDDSEGGGCSLGSNDRCYGNAPYIKVKTICSKITYGAPSPGS